MTKTAIFSNGFKDEYKGKRDVKAAWMIVEIETGDVVASGHSLTMKAAESTSKGHYVTRKHHQIKADGAMKDFAMRLDMSVDKLMRNQRAENVEYKKGFKIEVVPL